MTVPVTDLTGQHILVVEDDPMMSALLSQMLRRTGAGIKTARSGSEALEAIAEVNPDLILLDLNLPDLDGLDLLIVFREHSSTPIVVITGYQEPEFREEAIAAGASGYLTKPVSAHVLLDAIELAVSTPYEQLRARFLAEEAESVAVEESAPAPTPAASGNAEFSYSQFIDELDANLQDADEFVRNFVQRGGE